MKYHREVTGSQQTMPDDIEVNGARVYARANIVRHEEPGIDGGLGFIGWRYEEVVMSDTEYDRLKVLDTSWVSEWSAAMRTAERRARYERMDPKVSSLRRKIDLGIDVDASKEKLRRIQEYCNAVSGTRDQPGFPLIVEYPEEPMI